jgi:hypothetical protein
MNLVIKASVLGVITAVLLAGVGCSAAPGDDGTGDEDVVTGAATPAQNDIVFEQVKTCDNLFKDRAAFRDVDLQEGVLRWKCGDVDGVTISKCEDDLALLAAEEAKGNVDQKRRETLSQCGNGYGQEYCEYNAVSKGNIVNGVKAGQALKDADVVQCVFTSVQSDFRGTSSSPEAFANDLSSKVKPQLIAAERVPEGRSRHAHQRLREPRQGWRADHREERRPPGALLQRLVRGGVARREGDAREGVQGHRPLGRRRLGEDRHHGHRAHRRRQRPRLLHDGPQGEERRRFVA